MTGTRTYDLDFTLPTAGKSGCMVCHGDPNLVRLSGDTTVSIFVDQAELDLSAHKDTPCTGCHIDFAYKTPHENAADSDAWKLTARQACKNCHTTEFADVIAGAHSSAGQPGVDASATAAAREAEGKPTTVPLCGDCHAGHSTPSKEDSAAQAAYHKMGVEICGACHKEEASTYVDYYHGAAYQKGAPDAPACWDCHGNHKMLPADDRTSPVNEVMLVETCGQEGCHRNVDENFTKYSVLIHRKQNLIDRNPLWSAINSTREAIASAVGTVKSWFVRE